MPSAPFVLLYNLKINKADYRVRHGLRLSPNYQRQAKLLNCAIWLNEYVTNDDPWNALSGLLRGRGAIWKNALVVGSNLGLIARGLNQYLIERNGLPRKLERFELQCIVEQQPDPESRMTLSERTVRFGVPISRINWKINQSEVRNVKTMGKLVSAEFQRLSLNAASLDDWLMSDEDLPPTFADIALIPPAQRECRPALNRVSSTRIVRSTEYRVCLSPEARYFRPPVTPIPHI